MTPLLMSFAFTHESNKNKVGDSKTFTSAKHSLTPHHINNLNGNSSHHISQLQRTIDNQDVLMPVRSNNIGFNFAKIGIIQPKLMVSKPGDVYEQEADRAADM